MTINELSTLKDILQWASQNVKTDGMFIRVKLAREWVDRDLRVKTMDPTLNEDKE